MAKSELTEVLEKRTPSRGDSLSSSSGNGNKPAGASWYDHFATQLNSIITQFSLQDQRDQVLNAFAFICQESLGTPRDSAPPNFSRMNFDGIPLQYSLALGSFEPTLQFIGEVGGPSMSNSDRLVLSRERISHLVELLNVDSTSLHLSGLLDEMAPESDPDLLSNHAGALWISPSFSASDRPKLTVYINVKWGAENKRISRLDRFASYLNANDQWQKFHQLTNGVMQPLGAAIPLGRSSRPTGRIYLSAYGKPLAYYEGLLRQITTASFHRLFQHYTTMMLREDRDYPTHSIVCSIGLGPSTDSDFKFELCGHCAFESDVQAKSRCFHWLKFLKVDPEPYFSLLNILSENGLSSASSKLHAYLGIGLKQLQPYTTIYLKPDPVY